MPVEAASEESGDRLEGKGGEVDIVDHLGVDPGNHDVGGKGV